MWEAIILQHTYLERIYSLKNKKQLWTTPSGTNAVHTSGSNSQALPVVLSQYTSQPNRMSTHQKKESPLGLPLLLLWTLHRGGVLNAGKDCLENRFH